MIPQSAQRKNTFTIEDTTFNNGIWESDAQESLKSIPQTCKYGLVRCPILYESQVFMKVLADRAYEARTILAYISEQGASYVIPPQSNVSDPWPVDWWLYKERHLVECFFQKLKWFRRIATRYDKLDTSFLTFVYLASIAILLI